MNKFTDNKKKKKRPGLAWETPWRLITVLRAMEKDSYLTVSPLLWIDIWKVLNQKNCYSSPPNRTEWLSYLVCGFYLCIDSARLPQWWAHHVVFNQTMSPQFANPLKSCCYSASQSSCLSVFFFQLTSHSGYILLILCCPWSFENLEEIDPEKSQNRVSQGRVVTVILLNRSFMHWPHLTEWAEPEIAL